MFNEKLEELKGAIEKKNLWMVKTLLNEIPDGEMSREILINALETKHGQIIHLVAQKTPEKHFDREILLRAVDSNIDGIVRSVAQKTNEIHFDKELLKYAIKKNNGKIVKALGKYVNPKHIDREVVDLALSLKTPDVIRSVVDYLEDRSIFEEYNDKIRQAILKAPDVRNFAGQILSRSNNMSFDREMQTTIMDIYMDVINQHQKAGDLPKNFPIKEFQESMLESRYYFNCQQKLNFDSLENKDKFLLVPVYSYGHAFSAVIRKLEDDKYSVTYVNLGARPFEVSGKGNQYKEYVYTKENAIKVIKDHSYSIRLSYPEKAVSTQQAYKNFKALSNEEYFVNVGSRDQKVGNCFLKNIEKGVRFILAINMSKCNDKNFDAKNLRLTQPGQEKYKVKFLKPIFKVGETTNELKTLDLRRELLNALVERFPDCKNEVNAEWDIYKARKDRTPGKWVIDPIDIYRNIKVAAAAKVHHVRELFKVRDLEMAPGKLFANKQLNVNREYKHSI